MYFYDNSMVNARIPTNGVAILDRFMSGKMQMSFPLLRT